MFQVTLQVVMKKEIIYLVLEVLKNFSCSTQLNKKFKLLINTEIPIKIVRKFRFGLAKPVSYPANKFIIFDILIFMSRIKFNLS